MSATVHTTTDDDFESQVVQASGPVLVDYWAEWCAPCKMLEPILHELAAEFEGRLRVVKVNIDECPTTAQQYNIRGIPTLLLFADGKIEGAKVGALTKSELKAFIEDTIR